MSINFQFTHYSCLDLNTVILTHVRFFVKFYDDFSINDRKPTFDSLFLHILWD